MYPMLRPAVAMIAVFVLACAACMSPETDARALVAAQMNARLTLAQAADFRAYVLAADARQRAALERELALVFELDVADSRPALDAYRAIGAKRAEILAQLDRERETWLADPKLRQQERIADMLTAYAQARSEFSAFVAEVLK